MAVQEAWRTGGPDQPFDPLPRGPQEERRRGVYQGPARFQRLDPPEQLGGSARLRTPPDGLGLTSRGPIWQHKRSECADAAHEAEINPCKA